MSGPGNRVDLDAAMTCVGDLAGLSLDDALFAATTGDVATADRALEAAMAEGAAPGAGAARRARAPAAAAPRPAGDGRAGLTAGDAVKGLRPPVFYQKVGAFTRSLGLWPVGDPDRRDGGLAEAERGCKRTGWPDQALCRNAVLTLARRSAARLAATRR